MLVDFEEEASEPGDQDAAYKKLERVVQELVDKAKKKKAEGPVDTDSEVVLDREVDVDDDVPDQHHFRASAQDMADADFKTIMPEVAGVGRHR
jgi:hypothetical protein